MPEEYLMTFSDTHLVTQEHLPPGILNHNKRNMLAIFKVNFLKDYSTPTSELVRIVAVYGKLKLYALLARGFNNPNDDSNILINIKVYSGDMFVRFT